MFPEVPFFRPRLPGNSQIRHGHILPKGVARRNIETECFFHFSVFFVGLNKVSSEKILIFFRNFCHA